MSMSSADRIVLVLASVLLGFFVNIIYDRFRHLRERDERQLAAMRKLYFLAIASEAGITNERPDLPMAALKDFIASINDLAPSTNATDDFDELCHIIMFLESGGYENNDVRKDADMSKTRDIVKRCRSRVR